MNKPTAWTAGPVEIEQPGGGLATAATWELVNPDDAAVVQAGGVDSAEATKVIFTPLAPPVDVYTVVVRDDAGAELARLTNAFAVITAAAATVPPGITLEWVDYLGAVMFTVGGMSPTQTVRIIGPGDVLYPIRGYETAEWHAGGAAGFGYAFEMPLGVWVRFGVAEVTDTVWPYDNAEASVETPEGRAWLRDLHDPLLSLEVVVSDTGDELQPARQTVHKISGRPRPIVRWDVREARQGTVTLRVEHEDVDYWTETFRDRLGRLLATGRPLLLTMCHSKGFPPLYAAFTDVSTRRLGTRARWAVALTYIEVDNPTTVQVLIPTRVSYGQAQQIPPGAKYADWATVNYLDVATRTL